jgi:hypothetical protein
MDDDFEEMDVLLDDFVEVLRNGQQLSLVDVADL